MLRYGVLQIEVRADFLPQENHNYVCEYHRGLLYSMNSMRAKRKRKDSEEENDYHSEVT